MKNIPVPGSSVTVPADLVRRESADPARFLRLLPVLAALDQVPDDKGPAALYELNRLGIDLDQIVTTQNELVAILKVVSAATQAASEPAGRLH
ncbi:hypothetical protein CKO31_10745 [Thiohalocapsa halophila]|uniref:Uncharacterized protein n=1 Tax=Thiohalocapsa halophila TaxID=69359 RepID=A0ABS1CH11_9GAMM|nr:hypothetical protein [Thiohalocapsa halophila]MBK1631207.1 hypothetical protein [Thiohalocapsa halophila]